MACLMAPPPNLFAVPLVREKGKWLLDTNACIWGHWRAAVDALHDPSLPIPSGLTTEWEDAIKICRATGLGSSDCCKAHVVAEQMAIEHCGKYDSKRFGKLPTDVPFAPVCGAIAAAFAPPPPFTGDFGNVADRIAYGVKMCCS
jgi:hypothetical protein